MLFQAFIDESYGNDVFVMAGFLSSAELWTSFSEEWEKLLPKWGRLNANGKYHFHMQEMNTKELRERVPIFLSTIEKYITGYITLKFNISDLEAAQKRLLIPGRTIDWAEYADPNFIGFRCLFDSFHSHRNKLIELLGEEKVDFYFDENKIKKHISPTWDLHINSRPEEIKKYYGAKPRFEDDTEFLPLQAADLLAWWARKSYEDGVPENIQTLSFSGYKALRKKRLLRLNIEYSQDQLVASLMNTLRIAVGDGHLIYDSGKPVSLKV